MDCPGGRRADERAIRETRVNFKPLMKSTDYYHTLN